MQTLVLKILKKLKAWETIFSVYNKYRISIHTIGKQNNERKIRVRKEGGRKEESGLGNLIGKYRNYGTIYLKLEIS